MNLDNVTFVCFGKRIDELKKRASVLPEGTFGSRNLKELGLVIGPNANNQACVIHPFNGFLDLNEVRLPNDAVVFGRFNPDPNSQAEILEFGFRDNRYFVYSFSNDDALLRGKYSYH